MTTRRRSVRTLNVRPDYGSLVRRPPQFSSGWVAEGDGGVYTPVDDEQVIATALRILPQRLLYTNPITGPAAVRPYLMLRLAGLEHEVFTCVFLNARLGVIACEELFRGTLDSAAVHPREVVKRALMHNAGALIVAHNHPSGSAEPSALDQRIMQTLREALALLDIKLLDSLVVAGGAVVSMAERGLLRSAHPGRVPATARWSGQRCRTASIEFIASKIRASARSRAAAPAKRRSRIFPVHGVPLRCAR